ncbi:MAG: dihydropteroate synthase [Planctomycetota bacterium]
MTLLSPPKPCCPLFVGDPVAGRVRLPGRRPDDGDPMWDALAAAGARFERAAGGTVIALPPDWRTDTPAPETLAPLLERCRTAYRLAVAEQHTLRLGSRACTLGPRPWVMGICNVTPDSFSDGGRYTDPAAAAAHAAAMVRDGADCIDIGGESTRPGAPAVTAAEEQARVLPVIAAVRDAVGPGVCLSIDTSKAAVAEAAIDAGASMINDVTAGADPAMAELVAATGAAWVLMHMQGTPRTMQHAPAYDDVVGDVALALEQRLAAAAEAGVAFEQLVLDPGIGFGKTPAHNCELHARLGELRSLGRPLLSGPSRKSFLGALLAGPDEAPAPPEARLEGTLAAVTAAVLQGALIVRVHDVAATVRAVRVAAALRPEAGL